jgi:hypothetical protein
MDPDDLRVIKHKVPELYENYVLRRRGTRWGPGAVKSRDVVYDVVV